MVKASLVLFIFLLIMSVNKIFLYYPGIDFQGKLVEVRRTLMLLIYGSRSSSIFTGNNVHKDLKFYVVTKKVVTVWYIADWQLLVVTVCSEAAKRKEHFPYEQLFLEL